MHTEVHFSRRIFISPFIFNYQPKFKCNKNHLMSNCYLETVISDAREKEKAKERQIQ